MRCARAAVAVALAGLALAASPAGATAPATSVSTTHIASTDGTQLLAQVFRPAGLEPDTRTPVILMVGPYFGSEQYVSPSGTIPYYDSLFAAAIPRGYTIVQVTLRGYGGSGGCADFKGPGEQADARAAVEWAASQPWSSGRVGMYGLSYDASAEVMALGGRPSGLAAVVPIAPGTSAYGVMYMNGVRYVPFAESFEAHNGAFWVPPPSVLSGAEGFATVLGQLLSDPLCLAARLPEEHDPDPNSAFWQARELARSASGSSVPVLYSQGFLDANGHSDGFLPLWRGLRGPRRAWLGQYPHVIPGESDPFTSQPQGVGRDGWMEEVMRFLDLHLKGAGSAAPAAGEDPAVEVQDGGSGRWRPEADWPPADARDTVFSLLPGSYADAPGNKGEPYCFRVEGNCLPGATGVGTWTLSQPLPHDAWISGVPELRAAVSTPASTVHLVALLYDVDAAGNAALISRGATLAHGGLPVVLRLYPQDWRLRTGHRLGVLISGADDGWFEPGTSLAGVSVSDATISIPFLHFERVSYLAGGPSQAMKDRSTFSVGKPLIAGRTLAQPLPPALEAPPPGSVSGAAGVGTLQPAFTGLRAASKKCKRKRPGHRARARCRRKARRLPR